MAFGQIIIDTVDLFHKYLLFLLQKRKRNNRNIMRQIQLLQCYLKGVTFFYWSLDIYVISWPLFDCCKLFWKKSYASATEMEGTYTFLYRTKWIFFTIKRIKFSKSYFITCIQSTAFFKWRLDTIIHLP